MSAGNSGDEIGGRHELGRHQRAVRLEGPLVHVDEHPGVVVAGEHDRVVDGGQLLDEAVAGGRVPVPGVEVVRGPVGVVAAVDAAEHDRVADQVPGGGAGAAHLAEPRLLLGAEQRPVVEPLGAVAEVVGVRVAVAARREVGCTAARRAGRCERGRRRRGAGGRRARRRRAARPAPAGAPTTPGRRRPCAPGPPRASQAPRRRMSPL